VAAAALSAHLPAKLLSGQKMFIREHVLRGSQLMFSNENPIAHSRWSV